MGAHPGSHRALISYRSETGGAGQRVQQLRAGVLLSPRRLCDLPFYYGSEHEQRWSSRIDPMTFLAGKRSVLNMQDSDEDESFSSCLGSQRRLAILLQTIDFIGSFE